MFLVLTIALTWLTVTAVMCVLIGRAIRRADSRDEERAQQACLAQGRPTRAPFHPSGLRPTLHLVQPAERPLPGRAGSGMFGVPSDPGGSPVVRPRVDSDAAPPVPPTFPKRRRRPDPPRRES